MRFILCLLVCWLSLGAPVRAAANAEDAARTVAATLVEGAHAAMSDTAVDPVARATALKQAISTAFAFDIWERFLVGDRNLDAASLEEFRSLLPGFLAKLYWDQFGKGLEAAPMIGESRTVRRDVMVAAAIPRADGKPLPVEYRVREFPDRGPLVIDVMVGGISFLVLKREEFSALIDQGGAARLLAYMRENSI